MDSISISAAAGLRSRMEALDLLSNNLANSSTAGYKADKEFYSLFQAEDAGISFDGMAKATQPKIQKGWTDFRQGLLQPTGNPLDVALTGKGFFSVTGPAGTMFTRNGAFKLTADGTLATMDGYPVNGSGGASIKANSTGPIQISSNGTLMQGGQSIGQIEVVDFTDPSILNKAGSSYFTAPRRTDRGTPAPDALMEQGKVEASNVDPAESAVRLVELMRQYEMLQKAITSSADMNKRATDDLARVGP